MKILIISLLRLGDIIMAAPILNALRNKYPDAEIDILVNEQFSSVVKPLLPMVGNILAFPREELQEGLVDSQRPLFEPYDRLKAVVESINEAKYNQIWNFTHTRMSGYLLSLLQSDEVHGLLIDPQGKVSFGSSWFRYLNDIGEAGVSSVFHYLDIFARSLGLPQSTHFRLNETEAGKSEASDFFAKNGFSAGPKIILQSLTSDDKKNYGEENWALALKNFKIIYPNAQLIALGAPSEAEKIKKLQTVFRQSGLSLHAAIMSLEGALSLLNVGDLLVTGDTSIKHLAASTGIKVVEISLGSSDARKTGVYKINSLIIKSNEGCSPCRHSEKCHREKHFCAASVTPELVGMSMGKVLQNDWPALSILAEEYQDQALLFRTRHPSDGFWTLEQLGKNAFQKSVSDYLDRAAWNFLLTKEHLAPLATYGSECIRLKRHIEEIWGIENPLVTRIAIDQIENVTQVNEEKLNQILSEISRRLRKVGIDSQVDFIDSSLKNEIVKIEKRLGLGHLLTEKVQLRKPAGLYRTRQLQSTLSDTFKQQQIKLKLIRSLKSILGEYQ